jgi:pre-rRNA-processing protein TSR2
MELTDALLEDFQLEAEDGSPRQVATSLIALYTACCRNDAGPLQQLRQRAAAGASATAASRAVAVSWHAPMLQQAG